MVTKITATYTNSDAAPVSGFSLQVLPTAILPSAHHAALLGMLQIVRPCGCPKALASCIMIKHALQDILQSYAAAQEHKNDVDVVAESLVIGFAICRHALQCASVRIYMYATASDSLSLDAVQAAVPKFMQLRLDPASGNALGPQGSSTATQALHVTNTMHGAEAAGHALAHRIHQKWRCQAGAGGGQELPRWPLAGLLGLQQPAHTRPAQFVEDSKRLEQARIKCCLVSSIMHEQQLLHAHVRAASLGTTIHGMMR